MGMGDAMNIGQTFLELTTRMWSNPQKLVQAQMSLWTDYMELWRSTTLRMMGQQAQHEIADRMAGKIGRDVADAQLPVRPTIGESRSRGGAGQGANQAGGKAGVVSITGTGVLTVAAIGASTGAATGTGAGGTAGSITLSGSTATTGVLSTSGGTNGAGGIISLTTTSGAATISSTISTPMPKRTAP